ncbi:MAG: hypothetical protein M3N30_05380 [Bacteroidota bacterium]|nr:hypothetical protein [Bacteroidota bacterium]
METRLNNPVGTQLINPDEWTVNPYEELEISERTRKPPSAELIERLNHLASKPPFCRVYKMKNDLPRL